MALILVGAGAGLASALIAGRITGSAGWRSYSLIFATPLIVATIAWWAGTISMTAVAVALLGGPFIGHFIIYQPNPVKARAQVARVTDSLTASPKEVDSDQSIVGLRLQDAMVDADGTVYGTGALVFPAPAQGEFTPSRGPAMSMAHTLDGELHFAACTVERDDLTGYLVGHRAGPVLVVPDEASSVILQVLRSASRAPLSFNRRRGGALIEGDRVQGLTDLFGSVQSFGEADDDGGVVVVQLTASLRAGRKGPTYWPVLPVPEKVALSFTIKPMERVVRFGAHSRALSRGRAEVHQSVPSELGSMRLADTLIASANQSYGRDDDGSIVALHNSNYRVPTLTLARGLPERRDRSGLITTWGGYPRVWFSPVDLDEVAELIGGDLRHTIELGTGELASIEYSGSSPDGPGQYGQIMASRLDFELARSGLVIAWVAHRDEGLPPLQGRVTLPWEVLVMRFPRFTRYRERLLEP